MSRLFSPTSLKSVTFRNRLIMSPMCMYSSTDGFSTDWHLVHYGSRAVGGAGTVMLEATAVRADGRISVNDLGIYKDEHVEGLQRIASFIKQQGAVPAIQLAHAGRKASTWASGGESRVLQPGEDGGWQVIAPSPIPFSSMHQIPKEMDYTEIKAVQQAFADAAQRALQAGFKMIELHGAHGYLINEFLSPITNHRNDEYGGSRENRSKMLFETIEKVKEVWPKNLPFGVRISATDWLEGGWTPEDSVWLCQRLVEAGIDLVDVSSGGTAPGATIPVGAGYQVPLASTIKRAVHDSLAVGAVGLITSAQQAETILVNGDADFIIMGRELLRDPYFPLSAAEELRSEGPIPIQYSRAF